jgi:tRNA(Ile)-lysidine synthase
MLDSVRATCQKYNLLAEGDQVVVGVSGGADSCALLLALIRLNDEWNVAHLNHQIRGAAADEDAAFVQSLAERLNLPCTIERVDVPALAKEKGMSLEQAGRAARYAFFHRLADAIGASKIAVGHTVDDLLETMLLNWCRGAGAEGLAGMPPKLGRVIRPLFEVSREETQAFCAENGVTPRWDESNEDVRYLRNRVRRELVPHLKNLCPRVLNHAERLAEVLRAENDCMETLAREALTAALRADSKNGIMVIDVERLARQPQALQRRALRLSVQRVKGNLENVSFDHVEQVMNAVRRSSVKGRWTLPDGVEVVLEGPTLSIRRSAEAPKRRSADSWHLNVPGIVEIPELNVRLQASLVEGVPPLEGHPQKAYVDADKLNEKLVVRFPRSGERLRPLGMEGTKKIARLLGDLKVPHAQRARTLVVLSNEEVVWVVGCRLDERFKVTPSTRRTVILRVFSLPAAREG